jgi:Flp pilus assembly protein TadD
MKLVLLLALLAQTRLSSDYEIEQMNRQLANSHDFLSQLSAHLNLGDLRLARNETSVARAEYTKAFELASKQRLDARHDSNLSQYATATAYAGLAKAKLGDAAQAFALLDEATRYASDDAKTWNLFSSAMAALGRAAKATSAARNAVAIAEKQPDRLDLDVYRYTLATTLGDDAEAERLMASVIADLESDAFGGIRLGIERKESFRSYQSPQGDEVAYLSLLHNTRLRLGALYENRGDIDKARALYRAVLKDRSDDALALAAYARLSRSEADFAVAFDANPFSLDLISTYQHYLETNHPALPEFGQLGANVRRALQMLARGDGREAIALAKTFPGNDAMAAIAAQGEQAMKTPAASWLRGDVDHATPTSAELRALLAHELTPDERRALDRVTLTAIASFEAFGVDAPPGQTIFQSGTIGDAKIRFSEPVAFAGTFAPDTPLRLTFRILGSAGDALLVEPLKLEAK